MALLQRRERIEVGLAAMIDSGRDLSGRLNDQYLHVSCASDDEVMVTWAAMWTPDRAPDELCARCGGPLREPPRVTESD